MLTKLAYRNLWRNKRRTFLTLTAMTLSTGLLILILGLLDGMIWDMITSATDNYHGDAKVMAQGYLDEQKPELALDQAQYEALIKNTLGVTGLAARVRTFALLSHGDGNDAQTQPAELLGIEPQAEATVTDLLRKVRQGGFLSSIDSDQIVIGDGLATRLGANVGDELVAMGQAADGSILAAIFHVAGVFDSGDSVRDSSLALVGLRKLQQLAVLDGHVNEFVIRLQDPLAAQAWARVHGNEFMDAQVVPWQTFLPQVAGSLDMWHATSWVYILIFYFAVLLVTVNTMYMSFFERMREFAVMGAIGLKPRRLFRLLLFEGFVLSGIAALAGGAVGTTLTFTLQRFPIDLSGIMGEISAQGTTIQPHLQPHPTIFNVGMPVLVMAVLGFVIAWFPARRIRKLRPVEALRQV